MILGDDDFEIPAFLRNPDPDKMLDELGDDEDMFDFPTLDDDDDDIGLPDADDVPAEVKPVAPKEKAKPKAPKTITALVAAADAEIIKDAKDKAGPKDAIRIGDNSVAGSQLRSFIERVERLEEEKKTIGDDIKEVFAEAKGTGFDTKQMRNIIKLRKQDQAERQEQETILHLYMFALGME